jgi:hypothetical protein
LQDFAKVYEPGDKNQGSLMDTSLEQDSVIEAIEIEDQEKITDLKEFAKTSKTVVMDPSRFQCLLGPNSGKQST